MHPEIVQDKPGMCPECGMNLVPSKGGRGQEDQGESDEHEGHKTPSFLTKFWIALALSIPIFFYSEMAAMFFNVRAPRFPGSDYVLLALGSFVFFYCGWIFIASAYRELMARLPGMMTLIAIAITSAYLYSFFSIIFGGEHDLLFELSSLITVMLLGHWIEMKSVQRAKGALKELSKLIPDKAEIIRGNTTDIISISKLKVGDIVLIKPGASIPADGKVIEGNSELNEAIMTGESKPVPKKEGDMVIAGSTNGDSSLKVRIEKIGEDTFLAGVMRLVADAEASKSRLQVVSDRAAFYLTIIAIVAGSATFAAWLLAEAGIITATERLVAVLVITCPHALGLAVPLVASISTTMAARRGFLVRDRRALETARKVDVVLFDKTGTLTKGEYGVDAIIANGGNSEVNILKLAASVNSHSEHPLAKAMVTEAKNRKLDLAEAKGFSRIPGKGVKATIDNEEVILGSAALLEEMKIKLSQEAKNKIDKFSKEGKTINHIIVGNKLVGSIALADMIRDESKEAVKKLKELGIKTAMITGDSEDVAAWVAKELGIEEYFAKVLPEKKVEKVKLLQSKGQKVAMVGDGVNDAPALAQADVGIAIGAGANVAIESAGIILVKNDPRDIPRIFKLSRLTYTKMIQNLFWATGYNIVAIPLAAGVLAYKGIILEPAVAAIFMSVSTVIVAVNAVLLRGKQI